MNPKKQGVLFSWLVWFWFQLKKKKIFGELAGRPVVRIRSFHYPRVVGMEEKKKEFFVIPLLRKLKREACATPPTSVFFFKYSQSSKIPPAAPSSLPE